MYQELGIYLLISLLSKVRKLYFFTILLVKFKINKFSPTSVPVEIFKVIITNVFYNSKKLNMKITRYILPLHLLVE